MKTIAYCTSFIIFLSSQSLTAQDGKLLAKVQITSFQELEQYILSTEQRDTINLDPSRFQLFNEINLYGITYLSDSLKVKGFLLEPKVEGIYPSIIYNRGGSLWFGSLTDGHASIQLGDLMHLAKAGYVIAASQYRGNGGGEGQEEYMGADIHDVRNLLPILEQTKKADAFNVGMFGWSRGGATTFVYLKNYQGIKAVAVGGPATDYLQAIVDRPELDKWWSEFIPGYNENKEEILKARSVYYWPDQIPKDVPMLVMHGTEDKAVTAMETLKLMIKFEELKLPYRLILFDGAEHPILKYRDEVFSQVTTWFDRHLKQGSTTGD